ncbi:MAG: TonB-dependent receptor [Ferruginibacter sp.]
MKKNVFKWMAILLLSTISFSHLFAQSRTISGTVKDEKGTTLPGASVVLVPSDQKTAVVTDLNGKFSITVSEKTKSLQVSFVGMESQTLAIGKSANDLNIILKSVSSTMTDVVVIGYGTSQKSKVSSAISSITEKDIKNLPVAGADQMLQGKVAGVTVTSNSGQPGGGVSVKVRGITTVNGNQPLYVIDGVPILTSSTSISQDQLGGVPGQNTQSILATLNPNDIASIDILKDASAQAIYGSMAANGVVLITTKKGKSGEGKINYDVYYGWLDVQKELPLMNLQQYAQYYNSVVGENKALGIGGLDTIGEFRNPALLGKGTNWQDAVFTRGNIANHQLSFSGGTGKTTYYFSGNYYKQTGTIIGSGFKRYTLRASIDHQIKSWIKAGVSANLSRTRQQITLTDGQQSVTSLMLYNSPATPVKGFDGSYTNTATVSGVPFGTSQNPVALALLRDVHSIQTKAFGNAYVDLQIYKDLSFRNQLNYDYQLTNNTAFQPKIFYASSGVTAIGPSKLRIDANDSYYWGWQSYLTYSHTFLAKHYVNLVAGHEAAESRYENQYSSATNLTLNIPSISSGTIDNSGTGSQAGEWASESYFARLNYSYSNRYSISGSFRRDGSASFGPGNRWGNFSAGSAAWTVSNEKFVKDWLPLNLLKIRFGLGKVGNSNTQGSNLYTTNIRLVSNATGLFGQTEVSGVPANVGNRLLSWESVKTTNLGIDISCLKSRIELSVDLYKKTTTDMILATKLPVFSGLDPNPPNNGYQDIEPPTTNAGQMTNKGYDISLATYNIQKKNLTWKTNFIFTHYKNRLDKLNSESATIVGRSQDFNPSVLTLTQAGQAVGGFYGFVTDGLYRTAKDLADGPLIDGSAVSNSGTWLGDIRYKDLNGDGKIDDKDQTYIGDPNPKFTYGITNTFSYECIDLSVFLTGSYGGKIYNYSRMQTEANYNVYQNQLTSVMNRYTSTNTSGSIPRYNPYNSNNLRISDRFIENGSYLRIQNISLGINLPKHLISRLKLSNAKFYVSVQNLHTFTKYKGYDPELGAFNNSITNMNIDYGHYPNPRTFTVGGNFEF